MSCLVHKSTKSVSGELEYKTIHRLTHQSVQPLGFLPSLGQSVCGYTHTHTHPIVRGLKAGLWSPCLSSNPGLALTGCVTVREKCHPSKVVSSSLKQRIGRLPPRDIVVRWNHIYKCPSGCQVQGSLFVRVTFPLPCISLGSPQFPGRRRV